MRKTFERIVRFAPAYSKRDPDPKKDYGIGAMTITFILKGPKGATQFMIGTDWYLPEDQRRNWDIRANFDKRFDKIKPNGWDVGYHSPKPMYDAQIPADGKCGLVEGGKCFYDGSGLRADAWVPEFLKGGDEWVWKELEKEYRYRFERCEATP